MACLLPAEPRLQENSQNYPPEVDLSLLTPQSPVIELGTNCSTFLAELGAFRDLNDSVLRLRFVAQNRLPNTRLIRDREVPVTAGQFIRSGETIDPNRHFPELLQIAREIVPDPESPAPTAVGVFSAFVTDSPEWAVNAEDIRPGQATDLGLLPPGPDGEPSPYSVIEVRWAVAFNQRFECPLQ